MASQQERRRENTTHERNVNVEKDLVPKRATQFEELASKVADSAVAAAASVDADRKSGGARSATVVIGVGQAGGGIEGRDDAHFESISDKVGGTGQGGARRVQGQGQGQAQRGGGRDTSHGVWKPAQAQAQTKGQGQGQGGRGMERSHGEQEKTAMPSLEEMTNYRQTAQQNSIDAIRSAQQRYDKAKQEGANTGWETKEKVGRVGQTQQERRHGAGGHEGPTSVGKFEMKGEHNKGMQDTMGKQGGQYHHQQDKPSAEQVSTHRQTTQKETLDAQESTEARYNKAKEEAANAAWEAKEAAKHGLGAAAAKTYELGLTAKEKASAGVGATTQYISEKSRPMAETASETAQQAKEALSSAGQKSVEYTKETAKQTAEYAGEKAVQAKDTTVSTTKSVAGYVGQKAVAVGKSAAGLAGKVAEEVKDQAVVAGWGAAHLTSEVAVGATKKAGGVLGMAKDVVASAAHKATELAEVPVVMARDAAVDTGEKLADYTARKKMEAERYREEKHVQYETGEYGENQPTSGEGVVSKIQEGVEKVKENFPGGRTTQTQGSVRTGEGAGTGEMMEKGGSVLGAIGETVVEIAQSTANLPSKIQQGAGKLTDKGREMMGSMPSGGEVAGNLQKGTETLKQKTINTMAEGAETGEIMIEKGEGVLGAIGETIVEIAQHTTNLVAGAGPGVQTGVGQGQAGPRAQDEVKEKVKHKDSSNIYG